MTRGNKKPFTGESSNEDLSNISNRKTNDLDFESENYFTENEESSATELNLIKKQDKEPQKFEFNSESIYKINAQPDCSNKDVNKYSLQFYKESNEQMIKMKNEACKEYTKFNEEDLEIDDNTYEEFIANSIPLPKRPKWYPDLTKNQLLDNEYKYFKRYLHQLEEKHGNLGNLSYFELNLETWRQLWRTLEMSDIVLVITDIRYSIHHFPFTLYEYIVNELNKKIILILNKCDLVDAELVLAWKEFWSKKLSDIYVIPFSSYAGMRIKDTGKNKKKRFGKFHMASESVRHLYSACEKIVDGRIDISEWNKKIEHDLNQDVESKFFENKTFAKKNLDNFPDNWNNKRINNHYEKSNKKLNRKTKLRLKNFKELKSKSSRSESETEIESELEKNVNIEVQSQSYDYHEFKPLNDGILTIGCIGHPNVGKSSVLNAIMGKIVVSVSRTPGHTKHFQTIFLTKNVKLCDCPGLVFPSKIPKQLQILMGCFPIAQLREPYSTITYIAQRIDLIKILKLKKSPDYADQGWSAMEICEQWAIKRGYFAAKSARPDVYRAANQILRMSLDGRTICVTSYPPNYFKQLDTIWKKHLDLNSIRFLQCQTSKIQNEREREFKTNCKLKLSDLKLTENISQDQNKTDSSDKSSSDFSDDESSLNTEDEFSS